MTIEANYVGNGSTVLYSFTFEYIEPTDVEVSLDSVVTTEWTYANATTVEFNTAPASGVNIRIYRNTTVDNPKATFFPGSAIRAQDLNDNFEQILYVTQEADVISERAEVAAKEAEIAAALAETAATSAQQAGANAVAEAELARNAALDAAASASLAIGTADSAVVIANEADDKADTAIDEAQEAIGIANSAAAAVGDALLFEIVANVAAIPSSPANGDAVEVSDSTGIESFTPLTGLPAGFIGDPGLNVSLRYESNTWNYLLYTANDPDVRYAGPNTGVGTKTNPSIGFSGDQNTGIFHPSDGAVAVTSNGTIVTQIDSAGVQIGGAVPSAPNIVLDATGKVGIGESTPAVALHIHGGILGATASASVDLSKVGGAAAPSGGNTNSIVTSLNRVLDGNTWNTTSLRQQQVVDVTRMGYMEFANTRGSNTGAQDIAFGRGGSSETMRITNEGNVGIGTETPQERLDVAGTILSKPITWTSDQDQPYLIAGTTSHTGVGTDWGTYGFQHRFKSDSNGTGRVTIDSHNGEAFCVESTGNVGINKAGPQATLDVGGDAAFSGDITIGGTPVSTAGIEVRSAGVIVATRASNANLFVGYTTGNSTQTSRIQANGDCAFAGTVKGADFVNTAGVSIGPPTGSITMFAGTTVPSGWLECNGQSAGVALSLVLGQANVPDLRGEFVRGFDNGRGIDSGRALLSEQAGEVESHSHSYLANSIGQAVTLGVSGIYDSQGPVESGNYGGSETRPRNVALMYIIKS